jgi:hypothetical protein
MTVAELLYGRDGSGVGISSAEIAEWGVFFKLEKQDMEAASKGGDGGGQDFPGPEALMRGGG